MPKKRNITHFLSRVPYPSPPFPKTSISPHSKHQGRMFSTRERSLFFSEKKLHNLLRIILPSTIGTLLEPGMVGTGTAGKCMDKIAQRNMTRKKAIRYFPPPPR
ncbi:hypothetical protein AVEN_188380-1 [Araneus ventricosus]|uniref:Uncharacterized protein n=1 Tax=Araneus ventricosus TaxID=182803 RepID=A0A4Y2E9G1_ARAVE|nr:hypothetical protein AVEN_188380-1 [Araneus ventricosus]